MTIARVIEGRPTDMISCTPATTVREAINLLADKRIGALPVLDGDRVAGIFSERDVVYGLKAQGHDFLERTVGEVMTAPVVTVTPDTTVLEAMGLITRRRFRHLPVVTAEGAVVGFISIGDLVKFRIDQVVTEAEAMRAYIQSA